MGKKSLDRLCESFNAVCKVYGHNRQNHDRRWGWTATRINAETMCKHKNHTYTLSHFWNFPLKKGRTCSKNVQTSHILHATPAHAFTEQAELRWKTIPHFLLLSSSIFTHTSIPVRIIKTKYEHKPSTVYERHWYYLQLLHNYTNYYYHGS